MNGDGRPDLVYVNLTTSYMRLADERTMGVYWWEIPDPSEVRSGFADWGEHDRHLRGLQRCL